jgi:hypothetical protein
MASRGRGGKASQLLAFRLTWRWVVSLRFSRLYLEGQTHQSDGSQRIGLNLVAKTKISSRAWVEHLISCHFTNYRQNMWGICLRLHSLSSLALQHNLVSSPIIGLLIQAVDLLALRYRPLHPKIIENAYISCLDRHLNPWSQYKGSHSVRLWHLSCKNK